MRFTNDQLEEIAYIFERENGYQHDEYEKRIISNSKISNEEAEILEENVIDGIERGLYDNSTDRISACWALGKRYNRGLIPKFKKWLKIEFEKNEDQAVYQLLISLGNMEEPVFNSDRNGGSAYYEVELNMRDAKNYLENNSA
tara:strand:+ start:47 stop:475 length:429 start_codon:yes stop_codon:yes gene_type:complete